MEHTQQSINWLTLIAGPFFGVFGAFILARVVDASKTHREKLVASNLALLTLKYQFNEFLLFRKAFFDEVSKNCITGNEPLWALIRPAHIAFGDYEFDFKAIGFLLEKTGNGSVLDAVELVQISHRDLIAINKLRTENAQIVQEKIVSYKNSNNTIDWDDLSNYIGKNLTSLMDMLTVGMALRADRNEEIYLDAFNKLRYSLIKEIDSYYWYWLKAIFSCRKQKQQLVSIDIPKSAFVKESLPVMPDILVKKIAEIPTDRNY
jgi:hypothetical protein